MARCLNTKCDFKHGFFTCNLPVDTAQLSVHVETKWGKCTLKEDRCQRTERYRTWTKCNDDPRCILDSLTPSESSDSGAWLPTPETDYRPKLFNDPRNPDSSKENLPPLEPVPMPVFYIEEKVFLDRIKKLLGTDNNWEVHVVQQIPLPRTSSPSPTNSQQGPLEQPETFNKDDMDIRDFSERPANDMRPPNPPRKTKEHILNLIPPPGCPDYMAVNHIVMGIPKPPLPEIRSLLTEKMKVPIRWPACLKRSPPKATFNNNEISARSTKSSENLHEEP